LEAAHIKWHQAGGPDEEANGLALCALHHKLFDRGVWTLDAQSVFLVSDLANGNESLQSVLLHFHGKPIAAPQRQAFYPSPKFVNWHVQEVFKGLERER
jgi:putative restriction endonuclease